MNIETALRFLVKGNEWKKLGRGREIWQGFISSHYQRVVRVRVYGEAAFLTIKGEKIGDDNSEFEWPILKELAIEMLKTPNLIEGYLIRKMRYKIPFQSMNIDRQLFLEVDEFLDSNKPMQIAEIELQAYSNEDRERERGVVWVLRNLPAPLL